MMKLVVLLVLVGISAAAIVSRQRAVIPHYSHHGHGHGVSSRYFDKVEAPAYHGHNYGINHGYGYYPGYGMGYGAGLGYGYGLGYGGYGLGYGWAYPGVYTSVGL